MVDEPTLVIANEIGPNEELLWSGRPPGGIRVHGSDVFLIPFSLLWAGFACFWEASVVSSGISFFALWGIPFVLVGNYLVWGRFLVDAWQRSRTVYGVTSERIIIRSGAIGRSIKSLNLRTLSEISLNEGRHGNGTILFGPSGPFGSRFNASGSTWFNRGQQTPCFEMVPSAQEVYNLIRNAQNALY